MAATTRSVSWCMPRSRATAAIGRSDSRAMRTARCRNSGGYLDTPMGHGLLPSRIQGIPDTEPPSNPGRSIVCLGRRNGLRGVNGAIGAVATLFAALIYNFVAGMMAGIVINLDDAK